MAMKFTDEQQAAIDAKSGNVLVSASAGSGKTAVLTQRVYEIIRDGANLNELLILTFTNLAAQSMRSKIRKALLKNGYEDIAASIDAVSIQTYDAYALTLVEKYQDKLGLTRKVKIVDSTLLKLESKKILENILKEKYLSKDKDVQNLIYNLCIKSDDNIKEAILSFAGKVSLQFDSQSYLDKFIETFYNYDKIKAIIYKDFDDFKLRVSKYLSDIKSLSVAKAVENFTDKLLGPLNACETFEEVKAFFGTIKQYPSKNSDLTLEEKIALTNMIEDLKSYQENTKYSSLDEIVKRCYENRIFAKTIVDITKQLIGELDSFKAKYSVYDFSDIFKMAMKIASIPEIQQKLKKQYKYIVIDEYQDTSDIQEEFINMISNNNVFVVGDIKQSIYRFRNANCDLFAKKYEDYSKCKNGQLICLPDNFRSRSEVVDGINLIFNKLMLKGWTGLDYSKDHVMIAGNDDYPKFAKKIDYNFETLKYDLPNNIVEEEYEARLVATDIINRYNSGINVVDGDSHEERRIQFSDFAILSFAKTTFKTYQKVFNECGIPLYANYDESLKENDFTIVFKNIIKLISFAKNNDFNRPFKHCFISLMRSFLFAEKDETIEDVVSKDSYLKCNEYQLIDELVKYTKTHTLFELTNKIVDVFKFYEKIILIGDVSNNIELINNFLNISKQMDDMQFSVEDFARYYDELDKFEIDQEFSASKISLDCVQLMTIHASKGLEFAYTYFVNLGKTFNNKLSHDIVYDKQIGFDFRNLNYDLVDGYFVNSIKQRETIAAINEQLRVFYVALTRVREKGILLLNNSKLTPTNPPHNLSECKSFLQFYLLSGVDFNNIDLKPEDIKPSIVSPKIDVKKFKVSDSYKFSESTHLKKHISKSKSEDANNEALKLGTKFHYYLELIDFVTKDTSFIKDIDDKKKIDSFLSNSLFNDAKDATVCHEYPFYDEEEDLHGIIDLLLIYENHIDIVDYKLSNVSDESYNKQVAAYKNYIAKVEPTKTINTYILGILSGKMRKVD